jgi:hypothetical protein
MLITGMPGLTETQNRAFFSLWCMMAAPLMAGNDLREMSESTIKILTNPEAIAVNQDPLGVQGRIVRTDGKVGVWAGKPLFDGSQAVLVFNQGTAIEAVDIALSELGIDPRAAVHVRDLWAHAAQGPDVSPNGVISIQVEPGDVKFLRISRSKDFPLPPVIVADTYLLSFRAGDASPQKLTGTITLTNKGSSELPLWKVRPDLPSWLSVTVAKTRKTQKITNSVSTTGLKKGLYHAVVRLDNADPVSGKPMSAVYYDIDLEVQGGAAGGLR